MTNPFVRKLRHGAPLDAEDARLLDDLARPAVLAARQQDILMEGDPPHSLTLILDGWACRYKQFDDGRRQIITFFLPGDLCEPYGLLPRFMDHSLAALTPVRFARVRPGEVRALALHSRRIETALWWDILVQGAMLHERATSLGRRAANERFAHLLCELHLRLDLVGLAGPDGFDLPLTQVQIADALGLTPVHLNRVLREFRKAGLVEWRRGRLTVGDLRALRARGLFDPTYFHLDRPGARAG